MPAGIPTEEGGLAEAEPICVDERAFFEAWAEPKDWKTEKNSLGLYLLKYTQRKKHEFEGEPGWRAVRYKLPKERRNRPGEPRPITRMRSRGKGCYTWALACTGDGAECDKTQDYNFFYRVYTEAGDVQATNFLPKD